jgi:hypothetical protein
MPFILNALACSEKSFKNDCNRFKFNYSLLFFWLQSGALRDFVQRRCVPAENAWCDCPTQYTLRAGKHRNRLAILASKSLISYHMSQQTLLRRCEAPIIGAYELDNIQPAYAESRDKD